MRSYKVTRRDFEALEQIAELADQVELDSERLGLMQNPSKEKAASMYASGIYLWFREHGVTEDTREIAERHSFDGF